VVMGGIKSMVIKEKSRVSHPWNLTR